MVEGQGIDSREYDHTDEYGNGRTMTRKSTLPELDDLYRVGKEVTRPVEEHVSEPCSNNHTDEEGDEKGMEIFRVYVLLFENFFSTGRARAERHRERAGCSNGLRRVRV